MFDPRRLRQATPEWLDPQAWGEAAVPVGRGGRGAAWFVSGDFGDAVLRRYRRGGMAANLSRDRYVWMGRERVRSVAEYRLLLALRERGLPVPAPLLAGYWRRGAFYRAAILIERIPGARALADFLAGDADAAPWEAIGRMLARFHRHGLDHADLNAHNVLVDGGGEPWLIDFDRCELHADGAAGGPWRAANLDRLQRSLAKLAPDARWRDGFARLRRAHADALWEAA